MTFLTSSSLGDNNVRCTARILHENVYTFTTSIPCEYWSALEKRYYRRGAEQLKQGVCIPVITTANSGHQVRTHLVCVPVVGLGVNTFSLVAGQQLILRLCGLEIIHNINITLLQWNYCIVLQICICNSMSMGIGWEHSCVCEWMSESGFWVCGQVVGCVDRW